MIFPKTTNNFLLFADLQLTLVLSGQPLLSRCSHLCKENTFVGFFYRTAANLLRLFLRGSRWDTVQSAKCRGPFDDNVSDFCHRAFQTRIPVHIATFTLITIAKNYILQTKKVEYAANRSDLTVWYKTSVSD